MVYSQNIIIDYCIIIILLLFNISKLRIKNIVYFYISNFIKNDRKIIK